MTNIAHNLQALKSEIRDLALKAGRDPRLIKLIAVSKTKPANDVLTAYQAGQLDFGENYAQELVQKSEQIAKHDLCWHFIGHLQRNKVKALLPHMQYLHSLDRLELAQTLNEKLIAQKRTLPVLVEVKIAQDQSKFGCQPDTVLHFVDALKAFSQLQLRGLMMMGTQNANAQQTRAEMRQLKTLLDEINEKQIYSEQLSELSMGMSGDYAIAIEEGATFLRIGSKIFGER